MVGVRTPRKKPVMELGHPEKCRHGDGTPRKQSWSWDTLEEVMEMGHLGRSHERGHFPWSTRLLAGWRSSCVTSNYTHTALIKNFNTVIDSFAPYNMNIETCLTTKPNSFLAAPQPPTEMETATNRVTAKHNFASFASTFLERYYGLL